MEDLETVLEAYENCESKNMDCDKCPYQHDDECYHTMYNNMYEHLKALKVKIGLLEDENVMLYEENERLFDECNEGFFDEGLD